MSTCCPIAGSPRTFAPPSALHGGPPAHARAVQRQEDPRGPRGLAGPGGYAAQARALAPSDAGPQRGGPSARHLDAIQRAFGHGDACAAAAPPVQRTQRPQPQPIDDAERAGINQIDDEYQAATAPLMPPEPPKPRGAEGEDRTARDAPAAAVGNAAQATAQARRLVAALKKGEHVSPRAQGEIPAAHRAAFDSALRAALVKAFASFKRVRQSQQQLAFWRAAAAAFGAATVTDALGVMPVEERGAGYEHSTTHPENIWGNPKLMEVIALATERTMARVEKELLPKWAKESGATIDPKQHAKMQLHDLNASSLKGAKGSTRGHESHNRGQSADIGYIYRNDKAAPGKVDTRYRPRRELPVATQNRSASDDGKGTFLKRAAEGWDLEANWIFIEELMRFPEVKDVIVDPIYKAKLKQLAKDRIADPKVRAQVLRRIKSWANHDNHFHINVAAK